MRVLLNDNSTYSMDSVPEEIDDIRYCVLDYTDKHNPDYFFVPLVFLEIFTTPAAVVRIGQNTFKMPIDWSIIVCNNELGDAEILSITLLQDKGFSAFTLNPISSFMPEYQDIDIVDIYHEVRWHCPKLKQGHILAVPLDDMNNTNCAFFVKDMSKIPEVLDVSKLW